MDDADVCENWEQIGDNAELLDKQLEKIKIQKNPTNRGEDPGEVNGPTSTSSTTTGPTVMKILTRKDNQDLLFLRGTATNKTNTPNSERFANFITSTSTATSSQSSEIVLDSTNPDSLRTQYVPPQPKLKILSRPKTNGKDASGSDQNGVVKKPQKTLQQREQEYAEARMRILGDVRFLKEEKEAELEAMMSPAEILKLKINEAMSGEVPATSSSGDSDNNPTSSTVAPEVPSLPKSKNSKRKSKNRSSKNSNPSSETESSSPRAPKDFPVSKAESELILRQPRGPDGTKGFPYSPLSKS